MTILKVLLAVAAALTALVAYGAYQWANGTSDLRARLEAARVPITPATVDFRELEALPDVVRRYFRLVLKEGQPMIAGVRVRHEGTINMGNGADSWKPFTSDQRVITRRPGFDWDARVRMMPGLTARVHDAYVAGEGILHGALFGLFTVVELRGTPEVAEGELMRFLAEAAWYPTALLPSQGVHWVGVDARSAQATLVDGPVRLTMRFAFDDRGLIESAGVEARGRTVGREVIPTPWRGRFWNYEEHGGMLVPVDAEVAWLLPEGARPYWRGHISTIRYEHPQQPRTSFMVPRPNDPRR